MMYVYDKYIAKNYFTIQAERYRHVYYYCYYYAKHLLFL